MNILAKCVGVALLSVVACASPVLEKDVGSGNINFPDWVQTKMFTPSTIHLFDNNGKATIVNKNVVYGSNNIKFEAPAGSWQLKLHSGSTTGFYSTIQKSGVAYETPTLGAEEIFSGETSCVIQESPSGHVNNVPLSIQRAVSEVSLDLRKSNVNDVKITIEGFPKKLHYDGSVSESYFYQESFGGLELKKRLVVAPEVQQRKTVKFKLEAKYGSGQVFNRELDYAFDFVRNKRYVFDISIKDDVEIGLMIKDWKNEAWDEIPNIPAN